MVSNVKSGRKIQQKKNRNVVIVESGENFVYQNGLGAVSCSIGLMKGVDDVFFLEMGETFVKNDFFKDFGQKWKVRKGTLVFQRILSNDGFFNRCLTTAVFRSHGTMPVVRDVLMMVGKRMSRFS